MDLKSLIQTIPDFPKPGIMFRDVTTLFENPAGFKEAIKQMAKKCEIDKVDSIAAIESRGFLLGAALAYEFDKKLVLIRKKGKLPGETYSEDYELEYGTDTLEIHKSSLKSGEKVFLVDDLLATGGTAMAAAKLVEKTGATVSSIGFIIDLPELPGSKVLSDAGYKHFNLIEFSGH